MKRIVAALALVALAGPVRPGAQTSARIDAVRTGFAPIAALVEAAIARRELPGAVVLIGRGDQVVYHRAFGDRAVVPSREPMTEDTIFDLASLTKVVATTTSVMTLVEGGQIRLSDPVRLFIPDFGRYRKNDITIQHLLTHTSGLRPDLELEVEFNGPDEAIRRAVEEVPTAPPGDRFVYSDINFFLLGDIVRRVGRVRLDEYAKAHIFDPLGMMETTFLPPQAWRPRIAPTERCRTLAWPCSAASDGTVPFLRGTVHDPTARRMDGVAGHAGLFSTAADLSRFCRMLLGGGRLGAVRILSPAAVARMTSPSTPPEMRTRRGLGWDIDSSYSANRGELFPIGSFGHTGFTGTSLWLDPATRSYVIFLSNRVHPDGKGDVTALRGKVATVAAAALSVPDDEARAPASAARAQGTAARAQGTAARAQDAGARAEDPGAHSQNPGARAFQASVLPGGSAETLALRTGEPVLAGIDVLAAEGFARLRDKRVGLLTNQTGRSRRGESTIDLLAHAPGVTLVALFSPEHGIRGQVDDKVESTRDEKTGLPIHSLYGQTLRPTQAMLDGLDTVVVDLQDIGARFWSYPPAVAYFLEEAAKRKLPVVVLDRPNPIGGFEIEGPAQEAGGNRYVGYLPMPIRHGLTLGELASLFNAEGHIGADLSVVPMKHWRRDDWFDDTGLAWVNPSPNMRNMVAATIYPGIGAIERTNISVGRGTDTPFEQFGAPWIDAVALSSALNANRLPGVRFYPVSFTPAPGAKFEGELCHGVFVIVTDRDRLRPVRVGLQVAVTLSRLYGQQFKLEDAASLFGPPSMLARIRAGEEPSAIAASWAQDEAAWRLMRAKYLLY